MFFLLYLAKTVPIILIIRYQPVNGDIGLFDLIVGSRILGDDL